MYRAGIVRKDVREGVLGNDVTVNESMAILALGGGGYHAKPNCGRFCCVIE
jgi:hypothetical protein